MIRKALRRLYWRLRPARCECEYLTWPWHDRVYDADLGGYIHGSCASYPDEYPCPTCDVDEDAPNPACASWVHPGNGPGLPAKPTHHPRCLSLTGGDLSHVCDCETLRLLGVPESTEPVASGPYHPRPASPELASARDEAERQALASKSTAQDHQNGDTDA